MSLFFSRRRVLGATACVLVSAAVHAQSQDVLRIGWQKGGIVALIKARGEFEKKLNARGITVKWTEFPAGPQMLEGLNVGSIDLGHVGEAPPIFAQAANPDLLYVGAEPPSPKSEKLLVQKDSPIRSVADLKGKRVAFNKGSNVQFFIVKLLEKHGLKYSDVEVRTLTPSDARAAFEKGAIDAWVIWDPFAAAAESQVDARVLADGAGVVENYNFYISSRRYAEAHPEVVKAALAGIYEEDAWAHKNLKEAAAQTSAQIGLAEPIVYAAFQNYNYGHQPLSDEVLRNQQAIADAFLDLKLIPKKLDVGSAFWRPAK